jgi:predicted nucleotidyltransferase component of viral defense system
MLTSQELLREAAAAGFQAEPLEKVGKLLDLLESLRSHPFLKERIVLKGGTALNLFIFKARRLSVDINLNYIGSADREVMLQERPKIDQAIQAVCGRLGMQVRRAPTEHAGGKWLLSYLSVWGRPGTLALDVNFLLRTPLWPPVFADSNPVGSFVVRQVPILDVHELAAGKLSALFDRSASRDVYDTQCLLRDLDLDVTRLRLAFVIYGGVSRRDWRTITIDDVRADPKDVAQQLLPVLRADVAPDKKEIKSWCKKLETDCRQLITRLLPLRPDEIEFLTLLNDRGEIAPELLTRDSQMQRIIHSHPGLIWKAQNVRDYRRSGGIGRVEGKNRMNEG